MGEVINCFVNIADLCLIQVNINSQLRGEVKTRLREALPCVELSSILPVSVSHQASEKLPADIFDGVMRAVFRLMETDSLTSFKLCSESVSLLDEIVPSKSGHLLSSFEDIVALPLFCNLSTIFESKLEPISCSSGAAKEGKHPSEDNFSNPRTEAEQICATKTPKDLESQVPCDTDHEPDDLEDQRRPENDHGAYHLQRETLLSSGVSAQAV